MNLEAYVQSAINAKRHQTFINHFHQPTVDEWTAGNFAVRSSAALHAILPNLPFKYHEQIIQELIFCAKLQGLDEGLDLTSITTTYDQEGILDRRQPRIFCTYHFFSYRYILYFLLRQRIRICLPLDPIVMTEQNASIKIIEHADYHDDFDRSGFITPLDASKPQSLLHCLRALRDGNSVLLYVDGGHGVGGMRKLNDGSMTAIRFLDGMIHVRQGVCVLSRHANIPITPVICTADSILRRNLIFFPSLPCKQKSDYTHVLEEIFSHLGTEIRKHIGLWSAWSYIWRFAVPNVMLGNKLEQYKYVSNETDIRLSFNHERYGILRYKKSEEIFLMDKEALLIHKLKASFVQIMDDVIYSQEDESTWMSELVRVYNVEDIETLIKSSVLVPWKGID